MADLTPSILAVLILDAEGRRICTKYHTRRGVRFLGGDADAEVAFEAKLFKKTKNMTTAFVDSDAVLVDKQVVVFQARADSYIYVVAREEENEVILDNVLSGLVVALQILLQGSFESHVLLQNLGTVMLAVDEVAENGTILEVDGMAIANRVLMRGIDGNQQMVDMSVSDAMKIAKEQLFKTMESTMG